MANEETLNTLPAVAKLALKHNLVKKEDLLKAVNACEGAGDMNRALIEYLLKNQLMSRQDLQRMITLAKTLQMRQKELKFGVIAVKKGFISNNVLQLALEEQKEDLLNKQKPRRIGDILVDAGMFTTAQRDLILKLQNRLRGTDTTEQQKKAQPAASDPNQAPEPQTQTEKETDFNQEKTRIVTENLIIEISSDQYSVFLTKTDQFDDLMPVEDIKDVLSENNVVFGIVTDEMIQGFLKSSGFRTKAFRVAKGIKPVEGKSARIEYFFNTDYLKAGDVDKEGNIDFKDRGEIPLVDEGTVLAEKTPAVQSRNGRNVFGEEIVAAPESDILLKYGKGTRLSEDGLKILAAVSGYPKLSLSEIIFVHEEYEVDGDVDYETGHVDYMGNVVVKGCIKHGFKVTANDITAQELDGGIIHAEGNLTVNGGINEATVYAKGSVHAKFVHASTISCMGNVHIEKEIVDSKLESDGACLSKSGKVISSKINSKMGIFLKMVGTESTEACVLKIGQDPFVEQELKQNKTAKDTIQKAIDQLAARKAALEAENKKLQLEITEYAQVQDRSQLKQREIMTRLSATADAPVEIEEKKAFETELETLKTAAMTAEKKLDECFDKSEQIDSAVGQIRHKISMEQKKIEDLTVEAENLVEWMKSNPANPFVEVSGMIIPGTTIIGRHSEKRIQEPLRNAKIKELPVQASDGTPTGLYEIKILNR